MAEIAPFRGIRYNPEVVENLSLVVTPPYDVIDPEAQRRYHERHPYNIIRLELGYTYPSDDAQENRYTRAARTFAAWKEQGILKAEEAPSLYLYEQEFTLGGKTRRRTGFLARVLLEEYAPGKILPHEETLAKPKEDRLALLRACGANFSPVFGIYEDAALTLDTIFASYKESHPPEVALTDEVGEKHRLWVLRDPGIISRAVSLLREKTIYLADGHHRYETALAFSREAQDKYPGARYVLMHLVNSRDPGLVILPTHRIVSGLPSFDPGWLKERLEEAFAVVPLPAFPDDPEAFLAPYGERGETAFLMATRGRDTCLLVLRRPDLVDRLAPGRPEAWRRLDVAVLHLLVLERLFGVDTAAAARGGNLTYTRDAAEARRALEKGEADLAFILNPPRVEAVLEVARAGEKMPQKSTYFYPKLLTGLVLNDLSL